MIGSAEPWQLAGGLLLLAATAAATAVLILLLRPWLQRYALARPNARSSHTVPTPQGGGIAVVAATLGATLVAALILGASLPAPLWSLFAATVLIALIGAIDDIRTVDIAPRLLLQTIAVAAVVFALPPELHVLDALPPWLERSLLLLAGLWFVNLVNFMDGIDWMTVAEVVPVTLGLLLIGLGTGVMPFEGMLVALALCGAVLGFAPFNRPVARLFLGDVGSLPIGLLLLWLLILLAGSGHLVAALILPLYYVADATITLLRRIRNREPFWLAHRSHFYQRATDRGFSVSEVVARVIAVNVVLVVLAIFTVLIPGPAAAAVTLACAAFVVGWLLYVLARGKR